MIHDAPIFVFGCGWRTGSTLIQRLLCSHPKIHIWGEGNGMLIHLRHVAKIVEDLSILSKRQRTDFARQHANAWIAMLNPPTEHIYEGLRSLLHAYYRDTIDDTERARWGFKEVRCGFEDAKFLQHLFPQCRIIVVLRHPADCLASARATEFGIIKKGLLSQIGGAAAFVSHWTQLAGEFLHAKNNSSLLTMKHEHTIADSANAITTLSKFLDLDDSAFDENVFAIRRRGWLGRTPRLTREDHAALSVGSLWDVAKQYEYYPH